MLQTPTSEITIALPADMPSQGHVALTHWGVIRAVGVDAASFLQGQLTQDVTTLDAHHARWAGYCSAKGRLLATFLVWRPAPDEFLLACSADILAATLKRLSMFVLRAQCKLSDATATVGLVGRWHSGSTGITDDTPMGIVDDVIRLMTVNGHRRELSFGQSPQDADDPLALTAWRWLDVGSGVPCVVLATVDAFVPQMVNLELVGGVSFKKGCFPGQEVVARSQYRGTLKRRMHVFLGAQAMNAGDEVFHVGDASQPVGTVVNAATLGASHLALVSLKLSALDPVNPTHLALGSVDGALLVQQPPPYPVPAEAVD